MATITQRLETVTASLEATATALSAATSTCTTKASEASASASAANTSKLAAQAAEAAAEAAQIAAEAARDAASASATAAATSASNANTAKLAAQSAQTAAETAKTAAQAAQTAAELAQTAAANSAAAAAASASAAAASQSAAAASASAAAASQSAANTSANNASSSASAAATSAAQAAAIAAGLNYKGTLAGASVPATSTASGDCYLIISTGTSQGKTWAQLDLAIYNGTSGSWTQVSNALWAGLSLGMVSTRPVKDCLFSDGSISNRRVEWTPGTAGAVAAMPISIPFEFDVPTSNPTAASEIAIIGPQNTSGGVGTALRVVHGTSGDLVVRQYGATQSDFRGLSWSGFRAAYSGMRVRGMVVFSSPDSTTAPTIYILGADVSANFIVANGGTPPNWMPTTLVTTYFVSGLNFSAGRFVPHGPILGALTAAEVLDWTQSGRLPTWCEFASGSVVPSYTSDFSAGTDGWDQSIGDTNLQATGNNDAVLGVDDCLRFLASGGSKTFQIRKGSGVQAIMGQRIRVTFDYYAETGAFTGSAYLGGGASGLRTDSGAGIAVVEGSWQSGVSLEVIESQTQLRIAAFTSAAGTSAQALLTGKSVYFKNIRFRVLGPVFKPVIQAGSRCLTDAGTNQIPGYIYPGVSPLIDSDSGKFNQKALTANGEFLDSSGILSTDSVLVDVVVSNTTSNQVSGFALGMISGGDALTWRTDIPANSKVILPIKRADLAGLTVGTSPYGRVYFSALTWNSGSLNISIRTRRERDI